MRFIRGFINSTVFVALGPSSISSSTNSMSSMSTWRNLHPPALSHRGYRDLFTNHPHVVQLAVTEQKFSVVSSPLGIALSRPWENAFVFHHAVGSLHLTHPSVLSQSLSTVIEQDVEMDGAATGDYGLPSTPPRRFRSLVRQATEPDIKVSKEDKIAILERENAELREMKESALRKLSRNGKGTISNMETVVDRAIRERDELHAENQKLENRLKRCESRIDALREEIPFAEARIARAEADRRAETQKKIRWIWRVLTLTGSAPREFRKKDAEIDNLRKKLAGMHAELSKEQSRLQGLQGQLGEERGRRAGVEAELDHSRSAHAREIHQRDLAGQRLRNQLKQVVENLDSGAMSI